MKLATHCVTKPWGREDVPARFGALPGSRVGEVWFDHPSQPLPLLVKWLFTSERLSIQVHPDDRQARVRGLSAGKEECWIVVDAEPGAVLGIGTREALEPDALRSAAQSGAIEGLMDWKPVSPGDYYFIPAGTVHAIGAGVTLVEVQQNADVTYRLYDYGRPRELHLDDGVAVSQAEPYADPRCGRLGQRSDHDALLSCRHFALWSIQAGEVDRWKDTGAPRWIIPLSGNIIANDDSAGQGDCLYLEGAAALQLSEDFFGLVAIAYG
ncbi:class I mannose-6-phosphate isomerase [Novosphingobium sp.]|uniref:class I mannose-6-phosphate isomerase n=1 Tax=Novosphingobium sp. TaxID=1874826 RepID=UPI0026089A43|nr:class I mannose-6-phosphate isomerase [Novosphingobium sp.]